MAGKATSFEEIRTLYANDRVYEMILHDGWWSFAYKFCIKGREFDCLGPETGVRDMFRSILQTWRSARSKISQDSLKSTKRFLRYV